MPTFKELLSHAEKKRQAEPARADYWDGYIRGLHRGHYGHDAGLDGEHEWQVEDSGALTDMGMAMTPAAGASTDVAPPPSLLAGG